MGYVVGCVGHTLNHRVSSLQVGFPNLLLQIPPASQGADHYGRYDLPAFHLLVSALSLEQLRERSRFDALDDADDADLLPSPQAACGDLEIWELNFAREIYGMGMGIIFCGGNMEDMFLFNCRFFSTTGIRNRRLFWWVSLVRGE